METKDAEREKYAKAAAQARAAATPRLSCNLVPVLIQLDYLSTTNGSKVITWAFRRLHLPWIKERSAAGASLTRLCGSPGMPSERTEHSVLWQ